MIFFFYYLTFIITTVEPQLPVPPENKKLKLPNKQTTFNQSIKMPSRCGELPMPDVPIRPTPPRDTLKNGSVFCFNYIA